MAAASTRHVRAASGAKAATPINSISATAASGSARRPRKTFPPAWSQAAVNASRKAVPDTGQPYGERLRASEAGVRAAWAPGPPAPARPSRSTRDAGRGAHGGARSRAGGTSAGGAGAPRPPDAPPDPDPSQPGVLSTLAIEAGLIPEQEFDTAWRRRQLQPLERVLLPDRAGAGSSSGRRVALHRSHPKGEEPEKGFEPLTPRLQGA